MSLQVSAQSSSSPKRPRLSLQTKSPATGTSLMGNSATALKEDVDLSSPTAFNTLSNAYAAAIENSTPNTAKPTPPNNRLKPTFLKLETKNVSGGDYVHPSQRTQTPGPFSIAYPDTPSSAFPSLTPITAHPEGDAPHTATAFTFTPPQSAGTDHAGPRVFTFAANVSNKSNPGTPRTPRRRMTFGSQFRTAPYTHPRALHSILRNSPLPPRSTVTPVTPSRISMRIANRDAKKKVGYNDPLTQTITTNKYVKSHIDLLGEDSPYSATDPEAESALAVQTLDLAMVYTGDETRDGGQTPGPFEEMRRRMAESNLETPGTRKRKRKEKKRKWEWTISAAEGDEEEDTIERTPLTAMRIEKTPITAIRRGQSVSSVSETEDSEMSEVEERFEPPGPSVSTDSEMSERNWSGAMALQMGFQMPLGFQIPSIEVASIEESDARPQTSHLL